MYKYLSELSPVICETYHPILLYEGEKKYRGCNIGRYVDDESLYEDYDIDVYDIGKCLYRMFSRENNPYFALTTEYKIPLRKPTHLDLLRHFISMSQSNLRLFDKDTVFGDIVEAAWRQYGRSNHLIITSLYVCFLVLTTVLNYYFHDWVLQDVFREVSIALIAVVFGFSLLFMLLESHELKYCQSVCQYFFSDGENVLDWIAYILVVVGCGLRLGNMKETNDSASVMAVGTMLLWLKLTHFLRPFESTGPLVRMVFYIMIKIKWLLLIIFIVVFSFAQALYLLSYARKDLEFSNPGGGLMQSFLYMMGNSDLNQMYQKSNPKLAQFLLAAFILVSTILLLNLLIALMNSAYTRIADNQIAEWKRERAIIIAAQWYFFEPEIKEYQFYLVRNDDDDVEKRKEAEQHRSVDLKMLQESEARIVQACEENVKASEARIEEKVKASEDRIVSALQRELDELYAVNLRLEAANEKIEAALNVLMSGRVSRI